MLYICVAPGIDCSRVLRGTSGAALVKSNGSSFLQSPMHAGADVLPLLGFVLHY